MTSTRYLVVFTFIEMIDDFALVSPEFAILHFHQSDVTAEIVTHINLNSSVTEIYRHRVKMRVNANCCSGEGFHKSKDRTMSISLLA